MKRILSIRVECSASGFAPIDSLAPDGMLIVMDDDLSRIDSVRRLAASAGIDKRVTIVAADPRRMLYKLAGPFDAIFCGDCDPATVSKAQSLLAPGGSFQSQPAER